MRTIFWYLYFGISMLINTPRFLNLRRKKNKLDKREYERLVNEITGKWAMKQIRNSGGNFKIEGMENIPEGPVLFVGNHQSNFDIAVYMAYIKKPKGYVAKIEMAGIPLLSIWMKELRCIFIDREDIRQSATSILEGIEILRDGYSLVVFPEGTRSRSNKIGEFKAGSFKLATKSEVPIVPVTISGTYKLMEANNNWIKPADVYMKIHEPIDTKGITREEERELPKKVKEIIESGLENN